MSKPLAQQSDMSRASEVVAPRSASLVLAMRAASWLAGLVALLPSLLFVPAASAQELVLRLGVEGDERPYRLVESAEGADLAFRLQAQGAYTQRLGSTRHALGGQAEASARKYLALQDADQLLVRAGLRHVWAFAPGWRWSAQTRWSERAERGGWLDHRMVGGSGRLAWRALDAVVVAVGAGWTRFLYFPERRFDAAGPDAQLEVQLLGELWTMTLQGDMAWRRVAEQALAREGDVVSLSEMPRHDTVQTLRLMAAWELGSALLEGGGELALQRSNSHGRDHSRAGAHVALTALLWGDWLGRAALRWSQVDLRDPVALDEEALLEGESRLRLHGALEHPLWGEGLWGELRYTFTHNRAAGQGVGALRRQFVGLYVVWRPGASSED